MQSDLKCVLNPDMIVRLSVLQVMLDFIAERPDVAIADRSHRR